MAGQVISSLIVKLGADVSGFYKEMDGAVKGMDRVMKPMANMGKELTQHVTLPLLAVGAAFAAMTVSAAKNADELTTMAAKTGLSLTRLQELKYVASQVDTSFESLSTAAVMLGRNIVSGSEDGSKMSDVLARLGLNTQDATGKFLSMDDLFPQVISKLAGMEDKTLRNATAMQLFGKGGAELIPMLDAGADAVAMYTQRAHDLNLVMSDESIKALAGFYDKLDEVKQQFSMLGARIGASFMPIIQDKLLPLVQDKIVPALEKFAGWVGRVMDAFMDLAPGVQTIILGALGLTVALGPMLTGFVGLVKNVGVVEIVFKAIALKFTAAGAAGHVAATGVTAAGAASATASPLVTGLGAAFQFATGPIGLVVGALGLFTWWAIDATKKARENGIQIEGMADQYTYLRDQIEQDISLPTGVTELDETLRGLYGGATMAEGGLSSFAGKVKGLPPVLDPAIPPIDALTTHLEGLQAAVSGLGIDLDISKIRFDILTGGMDKTKDATAFLTAQLASEKEQLGIVGERITALSDAYQHLLETKGADAEETKKALLLVLQAQKDYDGLKRSIEDTTAALVKAEKAKAAIAAGRPWEAEGRAATKQELEDYATRWAVEKQYASPSGKIVGGMPELKDALRDTVNDYDRQLAVISKTANVDLSVAKTMLDNSLMKKYQAGEIGLATGGTVVNPGMYTVGERGIERVFLPAGSTVVPLSQGGNAASRAMGAPTESNVYNVTMQVRADDIRSLANLIDLFKQLPQVARAMGGVT